jgi:hypothetical protein
VNNCKTNAQTKTNPEPKTPQTPQTPRASGAEAQVITTRRKKLTSQQTMQHKTAYKVNKKKRVKMVAGLRV